MKFWSPFAPPLQRADIKKGHHEWWIEKEKVINRGIDEQAILEANKPPSGQWETEEAITQQYHLAYPTGFPTLTGENQNQNNQNDDRVETPEASSGPTPMSLTPSTSTTKQLRDITPTKISPSPKKTKQT